VVARCRDTLAEDLDALTEELRCITATDAVKSLTKCLRARMDANSASVAETNFMTIRRIKK
jgi:hypothetical protein